jgi:hypothetical protein
VAIPELTTPVADVLAGLRAVEAVVDADGVIESPPHREATRIGFDVRPGTEALVAMTQTLLAATGLTHLTSTEPDLLVIASLGETTRTVYERASLLGVDHLPVVIDEDRVRVGPLVQPGRTPCVGCHDLHRTDWDPAWPALIHQLGHSPVPTIPQALDPLTAHSAAVELAADGTAPRTIGRCLVVGPAHDQRTSWPIAFHPRCACDLLHAA